MPNHLTDDLLQAEFPSRLGWRLHFSEIVYEDPPYLVLQALPEFAGSSTRLGGRGIVWNVFSLMDSVRRPGAYELLTCDCGYAPDAGLNEAVLVSHPDADIVVWEIDIEGLRPVLAERFDTAGEGFIRLVFKREEYEADIRCLVQALQQAAAAPVDKNTLQGIHNLKCLIDDYPELIMVQVGELEPPRSGGALEHLLAVDATAAWPCEPLWPPNTLVEFGFFARGDGHELIRINGVLYPATWPRRFFTRWRAWSAFKTWLSYVQRAFSLGTGAAVVPGVGQNQFVLLNEHNRSKLHDAGRHLAALFLAVLEEGNTAPGVTVVYRECPITAAGPEKHP